MDQLGSSWITVSSYGGLYVKLEKASSELGIGDLQSSISLAWALMF